MIKLLQTSKATEKTTEPVTELEASSSPAVPSTTTTASTTRTTTKQGLEGEADINGHQRPSTDVDNDLEERTSEFELTRALITAIFIIGLNQ